MITTDPQIKADIEAMLGMRNDLGYSATPVLAWREVQSLFTQNPTSLLAVLGALCLVEQIGNLFELKTPTKTWNNVSGPNRFKITLFNLTHLNEYEVNAVYGLRCCLAHDYSLVNINKINSSRPDYAYSYILNWSLGGPLIQLPKCDWKGDFSIFDATHVAAANDYKTLINGTGILNLVRDTLIKLQDLHRNNELICRLNPTNIQIELISQYALLFRGSK